MPTGGGNVRVLHEKNGGVSAARNKGMDVAGGKWIVFVDSDDIVMPDYLQTFIELEEKTEADIVVTSISYVYEKQNETDEGLSGEKILDDRLFGSSEIHEYIMHGRKKTLFGSPFNDLFSASVIREEHIRFDETISYKEDVLFVLDYLGHVNSVCTSSEVTYTYIIRPDVSSASKRHPDTLKLLEIADKIYNAEQVISSSPEYLKHIEESYVGRMVEYIGFLYSYDARMSRRERLSSVRNVLKKVGEKGAENDFYHKIRRIKIIFRQPALIDFNGKLLQLYRKLKRNVFAG